MGAPTALGFGVGPVQPGSLLLLPGSKRDRCDIPLRLPSIDYRQGRSSLEDQHGIANNSLVRPQSVVVGWLISPSQLTTRRIDLAPFTLAEFYIDAAGFEHLSKHSNRLFTRRHIRQSSDRVVRDDIQQDVAGSQ